MGYALLWIVYDKQIYYHCPGILIDLQVPISDEWQPSDPAITSGKMDVYLYAVHVYVY